MLLLLLLLLLNLLEGLFSQSRLFAILFDAKPYERAAAASVERTTIIAIQSVVENLLSYTSFVAAAAADSSGRDPG